PRGPRRPLPQPALDRAAQAARPDPPRGGPDVSVARRPGGPARIPLAVLEGGGVAATGPRTILTETPAAGSRRVPERRRRADVKGEPGPAAAAVPLVLVHLLCLLGPFLLRLERVFELAEDAGDVRRQFRVAVLERLRRLERGDGFGELLLADVAEPLEVERLLHRNVVPGVGGRLLVHGGHERGPFAGGGEPVRGPLDL